MKRKGVWIAAAAGGVVLVGAMACCVFTAVLGGSGGGATTAEAPEREPTTEDANPDSAETVRRPVAPIPPPPVSHRADEVPGLLEELNAIESLAQLEAGSAQTRRFRLASR